ncbi:MAG TPA: response regulator, partial [Thermoanaerobaculia bacterium]|nr:response regulator [Thermoanaerobaculia bacterium]
LSEPILHVVRNALDHGFEDPKARAKAKKPAAGRLSVRAYRRGGEVCVDISDDGRGMIPKELRDAAVRKRMLTAEEAAALDDTSSLDLIFLPGFSTSTLITDTSGRGVGMDAVRTAIQRLGGSVETRTEPGKGTTFTFVLPLTVTLARVLLISVGERTFALPTGSIERIVRASRDRVQVAGGREQLVLDGEPIPLHRLSKLLLGADAALDPPGGPAILFRVAGQRAAFAATRLLDEREVVLKPLGEILTADLIAGATILPDGNVALVLDPAALVRTARTGLRLTGRQAIAEEKRKRILVVDDSTTTRELERSILAASGYDVETANDGGEGWAKLQAGGYDLLVTDVEMPGLTGFELTRKVRSDPRLSALPVVIITTLDRDSERRQGLAAGAQAYLVKNSFDQTSLLQTIERLLP